MRAFLFLMLAYLCCAASPAFAQQSPLNFTAFNQIPVLDNGRVKPLGAFAKTQLKTISGKSNITQNSAPHWLAETLFNPSQSTTAPIFHIKNDDLKTRLNLSLDQDYFALPALQSGLQSTQSDVAALLQKDQNTLTAEQQSLLKLHENVITFHELLRSFSALLPLNIDLPEQYQTTITTAPPYTYYALLPIEQRLQNDVRLVIAQKGNDIDIYTDTEQQRAMLSFNLQQIREGGILNNDLKIIPTTINNTLEWVTPWNIINNGQGSPDTVNIMQQWQALAAAYRNENADDFTRISSDILAHSLERAKHTTSSTTSNTTNTAPVTQSRLQIELIYQFIPPYTVAMSLYFIAIILFTACAARAAKTSQIAPPSKHTPSKHNIIGYIAFTALTLAICAHIFGITARIYILGRPPVGTLYESVLFVSLICTAIAAIAYLTTRKALYALTGIIAGLGLLSIAPVMLQNKDSLELLVAVLNTNFWLGTHVICITAGYGVCIIAACFAHIYLILRIKSASQQNLSAMFQLIHKISLIALLLTAVGTVLGGIWADQSWGRFWGWDPKENGALLIVLWLIWAQHGRLSGKLKPAGYAAAIAGLNVIVAIAWFGVNLLGVGLHSYGFTSGLASGLAIFCSIQTMIIIGLWATIRYRQRQSKG